MAIEAYTHIPAIAAEIDILTNDFGIKHDGLATVLLNGEQVPAWPEHVEVAVWEARPDAEFEHINLISAYSNEDLSFVGYVDTAQFSIGIETQLYLEDDKTDTGKTEQDLAYEKDVNLWVQAMRRNATKNLDDLSHFGSITPSLPDLIGFGYIMEETSSCRDGEIDGPASIAVWSYPDFISPQNEFIHFSNSFALGIPWVTFGVIPPEGMDDIEKQEKFLSDNAARRAEIFNLQNHGKLEQ